MLRGYYSNSLYAPGYNPRNDDMDDGLIAQACEIAQTAKTVLIFAGLTDMYESEAMDRRHMRMPASHDRLIEAVVKVNTNVVVILSNGSPVEMPWVQDVSAILEGYLGGQAGAGAIADILYGKVNPSGKLAETFPLKLADNPSYNYFPGSPKTVEYRESIYVGYRYYDATGQSMRYPFGYGLSFTDFSYSDVKVSNTAINESDLAAGGLAVNVTITNSGPVAGQEIVQLYVRDVESTIFRPEKELKGFAKVQLEPGESTTVSIELDQRAFAYYDVVSQAWQVESGSFELLVGASCQDIRLSTTVEVTGSATPDPSLARNEQLAPYYAMDNASQAADGLTISQEAFEVLCGFAMPNSTMQPGELFDINTPISDMQHTLVGRLLIMLMKRQVKSMMADMADDEDNVMFQMMEEIIVDAPLRLLVMMSGGVVTYEIVDAILMMANGQPLRGIPALVKAIRRRGR